MCTNRLVKVLKSFIEQWRLGQGPTRDSPHPHTSAHKGSGEGHDALPDTLPVHTEVPDSQPSTSTSVSLHHSHSVLLTPTMTAKNRQKSSSSVTQQDDASKKSTKSSNSNSSNSNGTSAPPGQGPRPSCLGSLLTTGLYVALIGAVGLAAFYAQMLVEDVKQMQGRNEERAQRSEEVISKMESVSVQVESLRSVVDGLESSLGVTRVELEGAISRMKRNEVETRRVEEALQKLQNDLLRELSEGIAAVKTSREEDFSSLEKAVEARLAEVSQSIATSMAVFTEAQGEAEQQLANLKAQLGVMEDPGLLKQELTAIVNAVAEMKTSKDASEKTTDSLTAQIGAVRDELQTRNQEVASLSQEVEMVRSVVQTTTGSLRQSLSAAEAEIQTLKDSTATLESSMAQVTDTVREVENQSSAAAAEAQRRSDELEAKVKASEEGGEFLSADVTSKLEVLFAKYDEHDSVLSTQGKAMDDAKKELQEELDQVRSSMEEIQASLQAESEPKESILDQQVEDLKKRLSTLEQHGSRMEILQGVVTGLEKRAVKQEVHEQAIAALQDAVQKTTETLSALAEKRAEEEE
ncbi:cytoskeleton-associated protein 4-like [Gouania willdenowi]|uniref:Cytoskeleton-associated protein 4 n=1 Tax=Gouania willdenowi TaxID=441366 RepID=A0A8C5DY33_GOUWI|nr:cytoskeleton-associated protein 4 [Gouania willdenowi]